MWSFSNFEVIPNNGQYAHQMPSEYKVFVNGTEVSVYSCRISKYPFNRIWPGHQRLYSQSQAASYVNLVSDEAIEIEVVPTDEFKKVMIKPYSAGVKPSVENGRIRFKLEKNGHFVLQLDSYLRTLYIFNNKPIEAPKPEEVTHFFGAGIHYAGKIMLHSDESVYVDKDAIVYGCIYAENAKNIRVFGNGIFDDSGEERFSRHYDAGATVVGNIKLLNCENVSVRGVGFSNSACWCVSFFHCFDVELDGIRVFGQWRYNTDGVDLVNSQRVHIKNSFIHSFDDSIAVKGLNPYRETNSENILTENCVLWCDWGTTCEIGAETHCREYNNIVFRNCDIIRGGGIALDIQNGDYAEVHDVLYEDIRIELESTYTKQMSQKSEDQEYNRWDQIHRTYILRITNNQIGAFWSGIDPKLLERFYVGNATQVHDVTARKITVYYDEDIPLEDGKYMAPITVKSVVDGIRHNNITLEDVTVNGVKLTYDNAITELENVDGFTIK